MGIYGKTRLPNSCFILWDAWYASYTESKLNISVLFSKDHPEALSKSGSLKAFVSLWRIIGGRIYSYLSSREKSPVSSWHKSLIEVTDTSGLRFYNHQLHADNKTSLFPAQGAKVEGGENVSTSDWLWFSAVMLASVSRIKSVSIQVNNINKQISV